MIIVFSPTKLFNENAKTTPKETMFDEITQSMVLDIQQYSKEALQQKYKVSNNLIDTVFDYYQNFDSNQRYVAFDYYLGESFKFFNFSSLNKTQVTYLNEYVYIIDALYGIIKPLDGIRPYRMDFTQKETKQIWRKQINTYFEEKNCQTILSLASKEFSSMIDKSKFNIYEVAFIDCKNGGCKKISVFNKQMRGLLLRDIVEKKIKRIKDLPNEISGYNKHLEGFEINYIRHS